MATLLTSQDLFSSSSTATASPCPSLQSLHKLPAKRPIAILLSCHSCVNFCMCILVPFKALSFISADATVSSHPSLSESYSLCAKDLNITMSPSFKGKHYNDIDNLNLKAKFPTKMVCYLAFQIIQSLLRLSPSAFVIMSFFL